MTFHYKICKVIFEIFEQPFLQDFPSNTSYWKFVYDFLEVYKFHC